MWKKQALLIFSMLHFAISPVIHAQTRSDIERVNFAFATYLGSGFYTSDENSIFILNLPFSTTIRPMTSDDSGWVFNYPVTIGVTNFDEISGGQVPRTDDVGTVSVVPGFEYQYPVLKNWQLAPFVDAGIARDVKNNINVRVLGAGVKSFVTFDFKRNSLTLGNRLLFADEKNLETNKNSSFAVFETGLDYNIPSDLTIHGSDIDFSIYYINYYYLKDLILLDVLDNSIALRNKDEIGFTFSLPRYKWLPDDPRLGLGVQFTGDTQLYRLIFGMPFF